MDSKALVYNSSESGCCLSWRSFIKKVAIISKFADLILTLRVKRSPVEDNDLFRSSESLQREAEFAFKVRFQSVCLSAVFWFRTRNRCTQVSISQQHQGKHVYTTRGRCAYWLEEHSHQVTDAWFLVLLLGCEWIAKKKRSHMMRKREEKQPETKTVIAANVRTDTRRKRPDASMIKLRSFHCASWTSHYDMSRGRFGAVAVVLPSSSSSSSSSSESSSG